MRAVTLFSLIIVWSWMTEIYHLKTISDSNVHFLAYTVLFLLCLDIWEIAKSK